MNEQICRKILETIGILLFFGVMAIIPFAKPQIIEWVVVASVVLLLGGGLVIGIGQSIYHVWKR